MNPLGTWQSDALDQSEQANRNAAMQSAQMANEIAYRNLQAHLEQQRMAQQGDQFNRDLSSRTGMHEEDLANSRLLQSNGQDFARGQLAQELAARNHAVDVENEWRQREYNDRIAREKLLLHNLGLDGGQPAAPASPAAPAVDLSPMKQMPPGMEHNPMAGYGSGAMPAPVHAPTQAPAPAGAGAMQVPQGVDPVAYRLALYNSFTHGTAMPDFRGNALRDRAVADELHQHELEIAQRRLQQAIDSGDTATQQQIIHDNPDLVMPRIDAQTIAGRPDVQLKLSALDQLAERATKFAGDTGAVASLKLAMSDAIHTLTSHGVKPEEASAIVSQRVLQRIPQRYGSFGAGLNDIVSAFAGGAPYWMGDGDTQADRTNAIHDFIGQ